MLRIAVQSKGRLYDDTMGLLAEAGIKINPSKRTLLVQSTNFPLEVLFLRDDDIPQCVADGVADVGVVGENEYEERQEDAAIIARLGFSSCRLSLAIPKAEDYQGLEWFNGKKIATSYPGILRRFLHKNNIQADIHVITGSVEISPGIGLADAIFDIVRLRFHTRPQQPQGGGSGDEKRGAAHRQPSPRCRQTNHHRPTDVPHQCRASLPRTRNTS